MKYDRRKAVHLDDRNYALEAKTMVNKLGMGELYKLYKIVIDKLQQSQSETRDKELQAVKRAIENMRGIDQERLKTMYRGYRSSMAANAHPRDGFTKPARKKV